MKFYKNQEIEDLAESRLNELGHPLSPPIPINLLAEKVLGLDFLWDDIKELPGEKIFGGLQPKKRLIVLNERHTDLFKEKPGLERSTIGHEMGHWDLFINESMLNHPSLFKERDNDSFAYRSANVGEVEVIKKLISCQKGIDLLHQIQSKADDPDEARSVNCYAACLSMPKEMICMEALKIDRTKWPNLYKLAEKFEVTISAMTVRLQQLNLLHINKDKKLFESKEAGYGQTSLGI